MNETQDSVAQRLRIGYVFSQFPVPTQTFAISDIEALRKLGHEVFAYTLKLPPRRSHLVGKPSTSGAVMVSRPSLARVLSWPGLLWRRRVDALALARLCARALVRSPVPAVTSLLCVPRALEIVEEVTRARLDVVHLFWSRQSALVLHALKRSAAPQVRSTFVGAYDLVANDFLVGTAMHASQAIITHSEANRAFLEAGAPGDAHLAVVHRGIPLTALPDRGTRKPGFWVSVSALVPEKNVSDVIAAFARARSTQAGLTLAICGDGPDRGRLERLARRSGHGDAIRFYGHVDRAMVFSLLSQASLFMLLSTKPSERLPNVVKEAMWSGCSIIVSPTIGIRELVMDDQVGHIVDPMDHAAVDAAVKQALAEPEKVAAKRRGRARDIIAKKFSSEASMARYVDIWRSIGDAIDPNIRVGADA